MLQTDVIPNFTHHVDSAADHIHEGYKGVEENEFIDACRLVYDGVREVRRAVLINREEVNLTVFIIVKKDYMEIV